MEVAKKLGTTQAAISQYLYLKRGCKVLDEFKEFIPLIQSTASEIASNVASGKMNQDRIAVKLCELCLLIQRRTFASKTEERSKVFEKDL